MRRGVGEARLLELPWNVEELALTGMGDAALSGRYGRDGTIVGHAGDNSIHGRTGNDTLKGGEGDEGTDRFEGGKGNDRLVGGSWEQDGKDRLEGGDGDDTYLLLDGTTVRVVDTGGRDTVQSANSYTLATEVENLTLAGWSSDQLGVKNGGNNVLRAGGDSDFGSTIKGLDGDDRLYGGASNDTLDGGSGNDSLLGGAGNDSVDGGTGDDSLVGNGGNDRVGGGHVLTVQGVTDLDALTDDVLFCFS